MRAALAAALILASTGCPTTHLSPNRRLEAGEVVVGGFLDVTLVPARVGFVTSAGLGTAELQAVAALDLFAGPTLLAGARVPIGPVNLGLRGGLVAPSSAELCPGLCPAWDLRLTTASTNGLPVYVGLHAAGVADPSGPILPSGRSRMGLILGFERWWPKVGVQAEFKLTPLEYERGTLGPLPSAGASDVAISGSAQMYQLTLAVHFDVAR